MSDCASSTRNAPAMSAAMAAPTASRRQSRTDHGSKRAHDREEGQREERRDVFGQPDEDAQRGYCERHSPIDAQATRAVRAVSEQATIRLEREQEEEGTDERRGEVRARWAMVDSVPRWYGRNVYARPSRAAMRPRYAQQPHHDVRGARDDGEAADEVDVESQTGMAGRDEPHDDLQRDEMDTVATEGEIFVVGAEGCVEVGVTRPPTRLVDSLDDGGGTPTVLGVLESDGSVPRRARSKIHQTRMTAMIEMIRQSMAVARQPDPHRRVEKSH